MPHPYPALLAASKLPYRTLSGLVGERSARKVAAARKGLVFWMQRSRKTYRTWQEAWHDYARVAGVGAGATRGNPHTWTRRAKLEKMGLKRVMRPFWETTTGQDVIRPAWKITGDMAKVAEVMAPIVFGFNQHYDKVTPEEIQKWLSIPHHQDSRVSAILGRLEIIGARIYRNLKRSLQPEHADKGIWFSPLPKNESAYFPNMVGLPDQGMIHAYKGKWTWHPSSDYFRSKVFEQKTSLKEKKRIRRKQARINDTACIPPLTHKDRADIAKRFREVLEGTVKKERGSTCLHIKSAAIREHLKASGICIFDFISDVGLDDNYATFSLPQWINILLRSGNKVVAILDQIHPLWRTALRTGERPTELLDRIIEPHLGTYYNRRHYNLKSVLDLLSNSIQSGIANIALDSYNIDDLNDRDVRQALQALFDSKPAPAISIMDIRKTLKTVSEKRKEYAIKQGIESLSGTLPTLKQPKNLPHPPKGWKWATPAHTEFLAKWVAKSGACLIRVLESDNYGISALALGPQGEVVGLDKDLKPTGQYTVVDRNNRYDDHADQVWQRWHKTISWTPAARAVAGPKRLARWLRDAGIENNPKRRRR